MPLINEPGISPKHKDNNNYNKIISYKNMEGAILGILEKNIYMDWFDKFDNIIIEKFKENYNNIIDIINKNMENCEDLYLTTGVYNLYANISWYWVNNPGILRPVHSFERRTIWLNQIMDIKST